MKDISNALIQSSSKFSSIPPVEKWSPQLCEGVEFSVDRQGDWHYMGSIIKRQPLVTLFCKLLRRDADNQYYCVTPTEKVLVKVHYAPIVITDFSSSINVKSQQQTFNCVTKCDQSIAIGTAHPLVFLSLPQAATELIPMVKIRARLWGFLSRNAYYRMAEFVETKNDQEFWLRYPNHKDKINVYTAANLP